MMCRRKRYAIEHVGRNSGLALVSSNTLMMDVQHENYLAMLEAAREEWKVALSLTFEQSVVDGAPAARFLQRDKELVEQPIVLLLAW